MLSLVHGYPEHAPEKYCATLTLAEIAEGFFAQLNPRLPGHTVILTGKPSHYPGFPPFPSSPRLRVVATDKLLAPLTHIVWRG